MVLLNSSFLNPWVDSPVLTFMHASGLGSYPATKLPETRNVLGIETNSNANTVVMGLFMYTTPGKVIRIDIFSVDPEYRATLVQVISTETECAGSGLLGTLASPQPHQYIALWGDLSNDNFFDTFKVHKVSNTQTDTASLRTKTKGFTLNFLDLGELYPAGKDAVFNCHAYGADHKYSNCLAILVYFASLKNYEKPRIVFHTVIKLPFDLYYSAENVNNSTIPRYTAIIKRMQQHEDGSMVCLVSVHVKAPAPATTVTATAIVQQLLLISALTRNNMYTYYLVCRIIPYLICSYLRSTKNAPLMLRVRKLCASWLLLLLLLLKLLWVMKLFNLPTGMRRSNIWDERCECS